MAAVLADPRLRKDVHSYLAEEVCRREDAATCRFLRRTCCLEHSTAELRAPTTPSAATTPIAWRT